MTKTTRIVFCNKRCYLAKDGETLVAHGHPDALNLFSVRGRSHTPGILSKILNAEDFFQEEDPGPEPLPKMEDALKGVTILRVNTEKPSEQPPLDPEDPEKDLEKDPEDPEKDLTGQPLTKEQITAATKAGKKK